MKETKNSIAKTGYIIWESNRPLIVLIIELRVDNSDQLEIEGIVAAVLIVQLSFMCKINFTNTPLVAVEQHMGGCLQPANRI